MNHPGGVLVAALKAVILSLALASTALAQDKDLALRGDAKCTKCHDQNEAYPVLAIGQTKHGTKADGRTPTCTSCHGASDAHVNKAADAKVRAKPDRTFSKTSQTGHEERSQACLTCHQGGKRTHWSQSLHANRDVSCTSCHQVHTPNDMVRDKVAQSDMCFTCHKQQRTEIRRQSRHPTLEGKVVCSDCHNPHGTAGEKMLVRDSVNDTCYSCHMEKRGPFVRTHQPVQENCALCHNPHGSVNDNLLRQRPPFLCQQCHEPTSHRGNQAGFTGPQNTAGGSTAANLLARGCLNCHTNIHGTNNPADISNERTFRR
ncbi:MAG TPA: DmsE family decaheme c-type cytochrome [Burkholderiales bacterium]|nr:DmsE family decaheme c-type cytochrome [Burkholderiales bacterium]